MRFAAWLVAVAAAAGCGTPPAERGYPAPAVIPDASPWVCPEDQLNPRCEQALGDGCNRAGEDCGDGGTGNGQDDDCNDGVDEGCTCTPGDSRPCFAGPPGRRGVGACQDGTMHCVLAEGQPRWSDCEGGILPAREAPDGGLADEVDNDCNGCVDEGLCRARALRCPAPDDVAAAYPFEPYTLDAFDYIAGGGARAYEWTIEGGPCDRVLGVPTYSLTDSAGGAGPDAFTVRAAQAVFTPRLSGDYRVTLKMDAAGGEIGCSFLVHVREEGLRIELCWDTAGSVDVDLHLHRSSSTADWFSGDDCFYGNCQGGVDLGWGYAMTDCHNSAYPDGQCPNPRLDSDNISSPDRAENINLDNPRAGDTLRVAAHYYGGALETHPLVNIYCDGSLRATYGAAASSSDPDEAGAADGGAPTDGGAPIDPNLVADFTAGDLWRVAEVTWGGSDPCAVAAFHLGGGERPQDAPHCEQDENPDDLYCVSDDNDSY